MTVRSALLGAMLVALPALASAQQPAPPAAAATQAPPAPPAPPSAADSAAIRKVVVDLFDGMRQRDTAKLRAQFAPEARLMSVGMRQGAPHIQIDAIDGFISGIPKAPAGLLLDERLFNTELRIDGPLATVWTEYDFYAGPNFSHCGVDAFQLARTETGWRIIALTDTRRRGAECPNAPKTP